MIDTKENLKRAIEFKNPNWVPITIYFSPYSEKHYGNELKYIREKYHIIFERDNGFHNFSIFNKILGPTWKKGQYTDNWGCVWQSSFDGIEGQVIKSSLETWDNLINFKPPDPDKVGPFGTCYVKWEAISNCIEEAKKTNKFTWGFGGRPFDRLIYLRGFNNLMIDIAVNEPILNKLIDIIYEYESKIISKWIDLKVDAIYFHSDIGTNNGLMINPVKFCYYLKQLYKDLFTRCRKSGIHVYYSSDGRIIEIIDDLIECNISIHDPQLGAFSIDEIKKYYKNRICINLDIDMKMIPFYNEPEIENLIKEIKEKLYMEKGGLMIFLGIFDKITPIKNIENFCKYFIKYLL